MRYIFGTLFALVVSGVFVIFGAPGARAVAAWEDVYDVTVSTSVAAGDAEAWHMSDCNRKNVTVEHPGRISIEEACTVEAQGVALAVFESAAHMNAAMYALKLPADSNYHLLINMTGLPSSMVLMKNGSLVFTSPGSNSQTLLRMTRLDDLVSNFTPVLTDIDWENQSKYYVFNPVKATYAVDSAGVRPHIRRIDLSPNNKYAAVELYDKGFGAVDLETMRVRYISADTVAAYHLQDMRLAIADDGGTVMAVSSDYELAWIYKVGGGCGSGYYPAPKEDRMCYGVDMSRALQGLRDMGSVPFQLSLDVKPTIKSVSSDGLIRTTAVSPDPNARRLEYLALGDSYSSGEGDVGDKGAYYLPGTKEPGQCHLSSRSYPFVLQSWWQVERSAMASVACSGAQILLDYVRQPVSYLGQGGRLKDFSPEKIAQEKSAALASKKPGIVAQVEFVKKYKPGVVTLTGGGNDVGFAEVLAYCASGASMVLIPDTCNYAREGSLPQRMLKQSIDNQYRTMTQLIHELRAASPQTKVYVVGYPQFVATNLFCSLNVALLDQQERRMIRDMTSRLNDVLSKAAADSGVAFVDIEDALDGGQLCQGSEYVSGLFDNGVLKAIDGKAFEMFHPNATGHSKMAHAIVGQVPSITSNISSLARPSAESMEVYMTAPTSRKTVVMKSVVDHNSFQVIQAPEVTFQPDTMVVVNMFSEPTQLGSFTADGNGGLAAGVVLPDTIAPGHHTVVLEGTSYSGEPITLYQFVTVTSGVPGDMDGDGVPDEQDQCNFIAEWIDEETGIDICSDADMQNDGLMTEEAGGTTTNAKVKRLLSGRDTVLQDWYAQPAFIPTPYTGLGLEPSPATSITENSVTPGTKSEMSGTILVWIVGVIVALIVAVMTGIRRWHGRKTNEIQ